MSVSVIGGRGGDRDAAARHDIPATCTRCEGSVLCGIPKDCSCPYNDNDIHN